MLTVSRGYFHLWNDVRKNKIISYNSSRASSVSLAQRSKQQNDKNSLLTFEPDLHASKPYKYTQNKVY